MPQSRAAFAVLLRFRSLLFSGPSPLLGGRLGGGWEVASFPGVRAGDRCTYSTRLAVVCSLFRRFYAPTVTPTPTSVTLLRLIPSFLRRQEPTRVATVRIGYRQLAAAWKRLGRAGGTLRRTGSFGVAWVPACAGMTELGAGEGPEWGQKGSREGERGAWRGQALWREVAAAAPNGLAWSRRTAWALATPSAAWRASTLRQSHSPCGSRWSWSVISALT